MVMIMGKLKSFVESIVDGFLEYDKPFWTRRDTRNTIILVIVLNLINIRYSNGELSLVYRILIFLFISGLIITIWDKIDGIWKKEERKVEE